LFGTLVGVELCQQNSKLYGSLGHRLTGFVSDRGSLVV
jgi:hypothetical protein